MKKSTQEKVKLKVRAWKDIKDIISEYRNREGASPQLITDLEELAKGYEQGVFKDCVE